MTRREFLSNSSLCKQLNDLLNHPVMVHATQIALDEMDPIEPDPRNGDLIQQAAITGMKARGANELVRRLFLLTIPPPEKPPDQTLEYDQSALDHMVKSGYTLEEAKKAQQEFNQQQL